MDEVMLRHKKQIEERNNRFKNYHGQSIPSETEGLEGSFSVDGKLRKKAQKITAGCSSEDEKAKALLKHLSQKIDYGKGIFHRYEDAVGTYKRKEGVCLDMAVLYTSMARSAGLEAGCTLVGRKHACSYVVIDGRKVLVDPTKGKKGYDIHHKKTEHVSDSTIEEIIHKGNKNRKKMMLATGLLVLTVGAMAHLYQHNIEERTRVQERYSQAKEGLENKINQYLTPRFKPN